VLLLPRLFAAAGNVSARLGGVRALPAIRQLSHNDLVHRGNVQRRAEYRVGERQLPRGLAVEIDYFNYRHDFRILLHR
jgi:hypothetical protein